MPANDSWSSNYNSQSQSGYNYDPRIGNNPLPPGIQGSAEKAYVGYTQPDQTSGYQITNMLNANNPYRANARTRGVEFSNKRGLLNSSIAAGNAERSAIEAAAPLAMQDANTFAQQARQNVDALNQQSLANKQVRASSGSGGLAQAQLMAQMQLQQQREQLAFQGEQNELQRQFGAYGQNLGYQNQLGLQNNQFGNQYGLNNQQYGQQLGLQNNLYGNMLNNQLRTDAFGGAISAGLSNQNFYQNAALAGMNNPAIIGNPQGFQGYLNYMSGGFQNSINDLIGYAFGGY